MKKEKNNNYTKLTSSDNNGEWNIEIQNDCSQIRIESCNGSDDIFIDTDKKEILAIRDILTDIINEN